VPCTDALRCMVYFQDGVIKRYMDPLRLIPGTRLHILLLIAAVRKELCEADTVVCHYAGQ